ncbi:uncharacterized protein LOC108600681 [Drosophila busckii]|uniref:uncharacterized protein LOC108600681 n=1 Tax=Drosophila busckii TaxID=30019 RepID=UPI00083EBE95|nr:uncharacterized protein LOC108600681 [Drosophila busckii]
MYPSVLILSYGNVSPLDIVKNLLCGLDQKINPTIISHKSVAINCFECNIITKYYNTKIFLIPFDENYDQVPTEIRKATEALIVYFDPTDETFAKNLSGINKFAVNNNIQLGFLITNSFSVVPHDKTIDCLKKEANILFDFITLTSDNEEQGSSTGYVEVLSGFKNFVWSSVEVQPSSSWKNKHNNPDDLENELHDFEKLLIAAQTLRNDSLLTREQVLSKAEELAEAVSDILQEHDSE